MCREARTNSQTKAHSEDKAVLDPDHETLDDTTVDGMGWKIRKQEQWERLTEMEVQTGL